MKVTKHDFSEMAERKRVRLERELGHRVYTFSTQPIIHYARTGMSECPFMLLDVENKTPDLIHTWNSIPTSEIREHADATDRIVYGEVL